MNNKAIEDNEEDAELRHVVSELLPVPDLLPKRNNKYLLLRITNEPPSSANRHTTTCPPQQC